MSATSIPPGPNPAPAPPDAFALYTVVFAIHEGRWLLLERAPHKRFAPGRWTGVGGRVESDEWSGLRNSALRELAEETGMGPGDVGPPQLRRILYHDRPGGPLTGLLYFTLAAAAAPTSACDEGTLHWVAPERFGELDIIETTAAVLPRLVEDVRDDPQGASGVRSGLAAYRRDGVLTQVLWQEDRR